MPHKDSAISVILLQECHKAATYWQGKQLYLRPYTTIERKKQTKSKEQSNYTKKKKRKIKITL